LSDGTVAVIGVPMYNGGPYFERAVGSLLGQSEQRLAVVLVDDGSRDGSDARAERLADSDPRVTFIRNERRLGLVGNWRRCYEAGVALYPDAPYFAWGSDHDIWDPRWLEQLIAALEAHPECVLAYPRSVRIGAEGEHLRDHRRFTSHDIADPVERFQRTFARMAAGNVVYGLFRAPEIARVGVFRDVLLPDRLLLSELAIDGRFVEVDDVLWMRRQLGQATVARQRATLFSDRRPAYLALPWWVQHFVVLAQAYVLRGEGRPRRGRFEGLVWTLRYARTATAFQFKRRARPLGRIRKRVRKLVHRRLLIPAARVYGSTLRPMRLSLRRASQPEPTPAPVEQAEPADGVFFSREPTAVEQRLAELSNDLGAVKKLFSNGLNRVAEIEKSIAESRSAIVRQESARVRFEEPRFTELARPVVDSGRTMLSMPRLFTLYNAVANAARPGIAVAEVGTYRGGTAFFLASAIIERLGGEVPLYVFDTFEGHPVSQVSTDVEPEQKVGSFSETSEQDVRAYLSSFELVRVVKGEAPESVRAVDDQPFALVHLDVDLYLPTLECLRYFLPRLTPGGAIVVDDYGAPSCPGIVRAVEELLAERDDVQCWPMLTEQAVLVRT
jgi:hypothetical protein